MQECTNAGCHLHEMKLTQYVWMVEHTKHSMLHANRKDQLHSNDDCFLCGRRHNTVPHKHPMKKRQSPSLVLIMRNVFIGVWNTAQRGASLTPDVQYCKTKTFSYDGDLC